MTTERWLALAGGAGVVPLAGELRRGTLEDETHGGRRALMLGMLLGGILGFTFVSAAWTRQLEPAFYESPWACAGLAVAVLAGSFVLGMIFVHTIGMASGFYMVGAAVAAVIALFTGQAVYALPLLLHAAVGWLVGQGQAARADIP